MDRGPKRLVELEDIVWEAVLDSREPILDAVLHTHLALEALLIEMLEPGLNSRAALRASFPDKTKRLVNTKRITENQKIAYDRLNDARNDIAHTFGLSIDAEWLLQLARDLEAAGIDFSDSMGHYTVEEALEYHNGFRGLMAEICWCVLYDAGYTLMELGGRDIFSATDRRTEN
ncbi:MAG: hypothetical protein JJ878_13145 [Alphaproteobacteria bacterium]|nr:hypothetical protein [Alphaproteobacteria bacterium]MBO6863578.1 hypothetical protein [Alphaproteobacteria bacterium]